MVSEIGLAQRRLFDDEAPDAERHISTSLPATASFPEEPVQEADSAGLNGNRHGLEDPEGYGYSVPEAPEIRVVLPDSNHSRFVENTNPQGPDTSIGSQHNADSETSYNIFDTSLNGTPGTNTNSLPFHESMPTEMLHRTPNRSKSIHATSVSPHDTEPFSSINAGRSKSDNNASQYQDHQSGQPSDANVPDELSAAVAVAIPIAQQPKKRERKMKQVQPEDDEDDELAAPCVNEGVSEKSNNAKKFTSHQFMNNQAELEPKAYQEPDSNTHQTTNHLEEDASQNPQPDNDEIQLVSVKVPRPQTQSAELEPAREQERAHITEPVPHRPKSSKTRSQEPKKKKLKRGKTTSVTVQKTYEPDVEDDVIWIDERERQSNPDPDPQSHLIQEHSIPTPDSISIAADDHVETQTAPVMTETPDFVPESQVQDKQESASASTQPKKRGRKRKNTSEQIPAQHEPDPQVQTQPDEPTDQRLPPNAEKIQGENPAPRPASPAPETPKKLPIPNLGTDNNYKNNDNDNDNDNDNRNTGKSTGPTKHSPIAGTSKVPYRVGLSRRARIAPLLKIIRR